MDATLGGLLGLVFSVLVFYWIVRLAVRHAIADADRRRESSPAYQAGVLPDRPAGRRPQGPEAAD